MGFFHGNVPEKPIDFEKVNWLPARCVQRHGYPSPAQEGDCFLDKTTQRVHAFDGRRWIEFQTSHHGAQRRIGEPVTSGRAHMLGAMTTADFWFEMDGEAPEFVTQVYNALRHVVRSR